MVLEMTEGEFGETVIDVVGQLIYEGLAGGDVACLGELRDSLHYGVHLAILYI